MIIELPVMRWELLKRHLNKENIPYEEMHSPLSKEYIARARISALPPKQQRELKEQLKILYEYNPIDIKKYMKETEPSTKKSVSDKKETESKGRFTKREIYNAMVNGEMQEITVDKEAVDLT